MTDAAQIERVRRYRQRLRMNGKTQVLLNLPVEIVEALDRLRDSQGASCRGDVVASLVAAVEQNKESGNDLANP